MTTTAFLPQETIRRQRDGAALSAAEIAAFVDGIARGGVSDAQCGAFAMAVCWRGLSTAAVAALTLAMRDSGEVLRWPAAGLRGPLVDKHSTGGVGDGVSLVLGPLLAACGCHVPMISGRALGHTGGTLDKLEAIPGYDVQPPTAQFQRVVREVGVAIVGAGDRLAPADRRLYAVRDLTATIDSVPLITASILSKKLAAGLDALVLDVKYGNGAFMADEAAARGLAQSLVDVGCAAGLPTTARLTAMDQPLAPCAGDAIEVRFALEVLRGAVGARGPAAPAVGADGRHGVGGSALGVGVGAGAGAGAGPVDAAARFMAVVFALGEASLVQCGVAADAVDARRRLQRALASGAAADVFARMVAALGGPADLLEHAGRHLAAAPVQRAVPQPASATGRVVGRIDTRALGLAVIRLGGGRARHDARIDPAVGLDCLLPLGAVADDGRPLAVVHAASEADADAAAAAVQAAYGWAEAGAGAEAPPVVVADWRAGGSAGPARAGARAAGAVPPSSSSATT